MFTTIITDCKSENAKGRQETRFNSFNLGPVSFVGINSNFDNTATLEAGGNLIDILDASDGKKGVVSINVAPRGDKREGENGNSFCYFHFKKSLVISTIAGYTLSFVKKFNLTEKVNVLDTSRLLEWAVNESLISKWQKEYISASQFRSFDFVPRVAKWLVEGRVVPSQPYLLSSIYPPPSTIWCIDAFGNCKLTITEEGLPPLKDSPLKVKTNIGEFPFYQRLKDAPKGEIAIYTGSSGLGKKRFLEIATQATAGSAAKTLKLKIGDKINLL